MRFFVVFSLLLTLIFLTASSPSNATEEAASFWTYDDDYNGQEDWGGLKGYEVCRYGFSQSPVNIGYTKTAKLPKLDFNYTKSKILTHATDKSLTTYFINGGTVTDGNKIFDLKSVEIHSPSGHQIKSGFFPFEIHLVHKDKDNNTLIVAVFAEIKNKSTALQTMIDDLDIKNKDKLELDASLFLPESQGYYSYTGSLPYPPCTEGVLWRIMKQPIELSKEQMTEIVGKIGRNTRLTQPLYMREVLESDY